jgi:hypothetical protein
MTLSYQFLEYNPAAPLRVNDNRGVTEMLQMPRRHETVPSIVAGTLEKERAWSIRN